MRGIFKRGDFVREGATLLGGDFVVANFVVGDSAEGGGGG